MSAHPNHQLALAGSFCEGKTVGLQWGTTFPAWFQTIPPERVGLNGEYDHHGLQKRVETLFYQHFTALELARLKVSQRGKVVVLGGTIANQALLKRMVSLAMGVEGAIRVETYGVTCDAEVPSTAPV
jgi:hypothetical protein